MPRSKFGRFKDGVQIAGLTVDLPAVGQTFYVSNNATLQPFGITGSDGNDGKTPEQPLATIDAAINLCTASRGDKIFVMPGHVEAVTATSIVPDVAGISIIGLGEGVNRPLLNFGATTSSIVVTGANTVIKNIRLKATIDSVVAGIDVRAAGVELDIDTEDTSSTVEFVSAVVTTTAGDNLKINARHRGFVAGNAMTRYIDLIGVIDATINVDFFGIASVAVVNMRTTACANIQVTGRFYNDAGALTLNVVNSTTATWSVKGFDAKAGRSFAGSDDLAVHYSDVATETQAAAGLYDPFLGYNVTKVSNLADGAGTDALFTVTGRCLITSLTGEVTTVIGGAATMKLTDTTNSVDLCAATTIDTDAVGTMYALPGVSAQILNGTGGTPVVGSVPNIPAGGVAGGAMQIIGDAQAALTISHILDAADTGAVTWSLWYKPLISGATIAAAA